MNGWLRLLAMLLALTIAAGCRAQTSSSGRGSPLVLERTIPLKDVHGRIDHLAVDVTHGRLFVAELGNGTVEAIDMARAVSLGRITGLKAPQGLGYLPALDELVVASGGDGTVRFYRAADLAPVGAIVLGADADDVRVDPRSGRVVVGYGSGALAVIDPVTRAVVARLALPAHPEGFELDGDRVIVNVPDAKRIIVGDLASRRITASWTTDHGWNFPMAFDAASGVVTVVFRLPFRLQALKLASGASESDIATCGDADDLFSDARRGRLYVICGSGAVDVIGMADHDRLARIASRSGARTGLFAPELDRLYVAARAGLPGDEAAILVFRPQP